jgi:phosphodiesterase/alkaline phosphatase D-like protein
VTHGPTLGRLGSEHVGVWIRTKTPTSFIVRYGTTEDSLDLRSKGGKTELRKDNTGWLLVSGLESNTRYFYRVYTGPDLAIEGPEGTFKTLPADDDYRDESVNPKGLFNFQFEFACGNQQQGTGPEPVDQPVYDTMLREISNEIHFSILNGDWLYERHREFSPEQWADQVGIPDSQIPEILQIVPHLAGVWENYKSYLNRGQSLSKWQRNMPSFFVLDDHELLDDIRGAGSPGFRDHRAVYRDIGVRGWYDYLGWSNPNNFSQDIFFGEGGMTEGSDLLRDEQADFRNLDLELAATLHVHWGGDTAYRREKRYDGVGGRPNAGVYEIKEIVDRNTLRINPPARASATVPYSVGRRNYFEMNSSNCAFFFLDTRSHRQIPIQAQPDKPGQSILGQGQKSWLKSAMDSSKADFLFVVSSVNFLVPHILDVGGRPGPDKWTGQHDSWTGFPRERKEMLDFWNELGKPVFLLTGDLHASFAVKITETVWEFASGAHTSGTARAASGGDYPASGPFTYQGMSGEIRWSTHRRSDSRGRQPIYCVVQVNNTYSSPTEENPSRHAVFPKPQVVFQFLDGYTGKLLYAEAVAAK